MQDPSTAYFKLFLLLSDKRTIALCPGPGLLLQDSRGQTKKVIWVARVPKAHRPEPLLTAPVLLLQKCFSLTLAADNPALQGHSLLDPQCTPLAVCF